MTKLAPPRMGSESDSSSRDVFRYADMSDPAP